MDAVGMIATVEAVDKGMLAARRWVQTGVRDVLSDTITQLIEDLQLGSTEPVATVLIQAIDHDLWPQTATVAVDWVAGFKGELPPERRETTAPDLWMDTFSPELHQAATHVRALGFKRVRIDGAFRLATAIHAGYVFSDVRGFRVSVPGRSGDGTWTGDIAADGSRLNPTITRTDHPLGYGHELAVGLNVSGDLTAAVVRHLGNTSTPVEQLTVLSVLTVARDALADPAEIRGWAAAVTDQLRALAEDSWPRIHLFFYGPRAAAVLLGHHWNRMPPTQLWDDLGPARGYARAFEFPAT